MRSVSKLSRCHVDNSVVETASCQTKSAQRETEETRSPALPGNADPEALPPPNSLLAGDEAEPLDMGSQAEPGNQLKLKFNTQIT